MAEQGTLQWHLAQLNARRAAFINMLADPELSVEDRDAWATRLAEVEVLLADIAKDPLGYTAWLLAAKHTALRRQTDRFTQ